MIRDTKMAISGLSCTFKAWDSMRTLNAKSENNVRDMEACYNTQPDQILLQQTWTEDQYLPCEDQGKTEG